jgi:hypothetical protein
LDQGFFQIQTRWHLHWICGYIPNIQEGSAKLFDVLLGRTDRPEAEFIPGRIMNPVMVGSQAAVYNHGVTQLKFSNRVRQIVGSYDSHLKACVDV